ncbi:MAG: hypothetical protein AAGE65_06550 [Planctomycetota bacterium]
MSSKKFIPNGDRDFAAMAKGFTTALGRDPRKFAVAPEDAEAVAAAVDAFEVALNEARGGSGVGRASGAAGASGGRSMSPTLTLRKAEARKEAETWIRRVAGAVRSNDRISASDKALLGIAPRKKAGEAASEAERTAGEALRRSPYLEFVRAIHRSAHVPEHELRFRRPDGSGMPAGVARLELFVELVPPDEAVPDRPGGSGYGCHYLRSFVKSPVVLTPPLADRPMRVVYWGRWADARGEVGPMSAAAAGWVEGGSHHLMGPGVIGGEQGRLPTRPKEVNAQRLAAVAARLPRLAAEATGPEVGVSESGPAAAVKAPGVSVRLPGAA